MNKLYKPSIGEIKQVNARSGNGYFFSRSTMRFFGKQKMSIVLNAEKTAYILKIVFEDPARIAYYEIIDNGKDFRSIN